MVKSCNMSFLKHRIEFHRQKTHRFAIFIVKNNDGLSNGNENGFSADHTTFKAIHILCCNAHCYISWALKNTHMPQIVFSHIINMGRTFLDKVEAHFIPLTGKLYSLQCSQIAIHQMYGNVGLHTQCTLMHMDGSHTGMNHVDTH